MKNKTKHKYATKEFIESVEKEVEQFLTNETVCGAIQKTTEGENGNKVMVLILTIGEERGDKKLMKIGEKAIEKIIPTKHLQRLP